MKKTANKKNLIPVVTSLVDNIFGKYRLEEATFDKSTKTLEISMSTKAYGDGWDFTAYYNKKNKDLWTSTNRYHDKFVELCKSIYADFNGINIINLSYYGD